MRILLHTLLFPPDGNSNAYIFGDLARELRRLGHDVRVLTTTPHYNVVEASLARQPMKSVRGRWLFESDFDGIPCLHVAVPSQKGGMLKRATTAIRFHVIALLVALGRRFACDVVLSQSPPLSIGLLSVWIARWHGARAVYVAQDIFPDGLIQQGRIRNPLFIRLLRALERRVYARSDAVCTISGGLAEILSRRIPSGTKLRTIPNFVDAELYRPLPRDNRFSREQRLDGAFVVSYVGNLGNAQNFTPVLEAAAGLHELPITFLLVGGGIKQEALEREVRERGLHRVRVLGYQPRNATPLINAASDIGLVLLSPHVQNFSFPSKVYTLMACAKPILLYGNPDADVARFVRDLGIGWVVPEGDVRGFRDTVDQLYRNPGALKERGDRGRAVVAERFTAPTVAMQYDQLFRELLVDRR